MILFTKAYWKYIFSLKELALIVLSVIGGVWTLIEVSSYFTPVFNEFIKENWWLVLIFVLLVSMYRFWPSLSIKKKIIHTDVNISIIVGDMLSKHYSHDLVIPFNTSFDTEISSGIISSKSVQGQFTNQQYDNIKHLDSDIEETNKCREKIELPGKQRGNKYRYPIGSTVKIKLPKSSSRFAYLCCMADMNDNCNASTDLAKVQEALAHLWTFIMDKGELSDIAIPILGTGRGRTTESRENIIYEIIDSFLAANRYHKIADSLTIFIWPGDLKTYDIDFKRIETYLHFQTNYIRSSKSAIKGTAVE